MEKIKMQNKKIRSKGQMSYIMKPLSLMMTIILLVFLYQTLQEYGGREAQAKQGLDLSTDATSILLILANSGDCLAYKGEEAQSLYANLIDVYKLSEYKNIYANIEPECARSYVYGWSVTVREVSQNKSEQVNTWSFGAAQLTPEKIAGRNNPSFYNRIEYGMPAAIRYSREFIRPAVMDIVLVDGELERVAGVLDWACQLGMQNKLDKNSFQLKELDINIQNPIKYNKNTGELCSMTEQPTCRQMMCRMDFEDMDVGEHMLQINYVNGRLVVKT
jgi:hypothetical protein